MKLRLLSVGITHNSFIHTIKPTTQKHIHSKKLNKMEEISKNNETTQLGIGAVMPRFHFTRFHKGTEHSGWEIAIFGFCFKWMKFPNFRKYAYW